MQKVQQHVSSSAPQQACSAGRCCCCAALQAVPCSCSPAMPLTMPTEEKKRMRLARERSVRPLMPQVPEGEMQAGGGQVQAGGGRDKGWLHDGWVLPAERYRYC